MPALYTIVIANLLIGWQKWSTHFEHPIIQNTVSAIASKNNFTGMIQVYLHTIFLEISQNALMSAMLAWSKR